MTWDHELRILNDAIRTAGAEALRFVSDGFETHTKSDQSPVTSADLAVNHILQSHLLAMFPHDGWLSEESPDDPARLQKARVWVIDPIDGTKAFIRGEPEFCISVALVEEGRPVVAAIFNPSTDELFTATRGGGLHLNHKPVSPQERRRDQQPVIALSPWEQHIGRFKSVVAHAASRPMRSIAWALALAASGRIHAVATFELENEWDVAAGALLIEEAGGNMHDGSGQALSFNRPEPRYRGILATSAHCPDPFAQQLRSFSRIAK
ncbi:MAG: 3'(2'),5'-bisphosphate nucleotidase CysQ [Nitrospira sp.]|nr:MAG: 3'(2'),5'-bisphosphate nucleotidase CysQ [Nitrospira sp.]